MGLALGRGASVSPVCTPHVLPRTTLHLPAGEGGAPGSRGTPTRHPGAAGLQAACTPQARAAPRPASARLSRGLRAGGPGAWQRRGQAPTCASCNSGGQFGHKEQGVGAAAPLVRRQAQPRPRRRRTHSLGTFQKPGRGWEGWLPPVAAPVLATGSSSLSRPQPSGHRVCSCVSCPGPSGECPWGLWSPQDRLENPQPGLRGPERDTSEGGTPVGTLVPLI